VGYSPWRAREAAGTDPLLPQAAKSSRKCPPISHADGGPSLPASSSLLCGRHSRIDSNSSDRTSKALPPTSQPSECLGAFCSKLKTGCRLHHHQAMVSPQNSFHHDISPGCTRLAFHFILLEILPQRLLNLGQPVLA